MADIPRLTRTGPTPGLGIVHLGPGAFFRAFHAVFTDEAMEHAGGDWGIAAVSLKSRAAYDQLRPQNGVFTSVTLGRDGNTHRIVQSVTDVLVAPDDPQAVIDLMADPRVRIVSLTITEKGYGFDPATGGLDPTHVDIAHDLENPGRPASAAGLIVAALRARRDAGLPAFTVLSCDNLPSNGVATKAVVLGFARLIDADLAEWIDSNATFPSTMVDRITPATTEKDIAALQSQSGYNDPACVVHEGFRQWVIEDDFAQGRPAWDMAGAQFVTCVEAHERMKLRCLNGTHSAMAYLGYLAGYESIFDTISDPLFRRYIQGLWREEIRPTLPPPEGADLTAYCKALLDRYSDPAIHHRTWQIAMDGSQKLPQRLLGTIRDRLDKGVTPRGLCLAVAGWMKYVGGMDEAGDPIDVRDPLAERLRATSDDSRTPSGTVLALLRFSEVFDPDLAQHPDFVAQLIASFDLLDRKGAKAAVQRVLSH